MIRFISSKETLDLRSKVLRNNLPTGACVFPTDDVEGAFHLGCLVNETLVSVASFFPNRYKEESANGYQLRGMATLKEEAGKGYGAKIIDFAQIHLMGTDAHYLWCNARSSAVEFYKKMGFKLVSEEFEIEGVGPHYEMLKFILTSDKERN